MTKPKALLCWCGGKATVMVSWQASLKVTSAPLCKAHGGPGVISRLGMGRAIAVEKVKREKPDDEVAPPELNLE